MGESQNTKSKTLVSGNWIFCSHRWAASSGWFQIALSYLLILHLTPSFSIAGLSMVALGMTHWSSLFKHVMNHSRSRATADLVSRGSRLWWDQPVNAPLKLHHFVHWLTKMLLFFHTEPCDLSGLESVIFSSVKSISICLEISSKLATFEMMSDKS